MKKYPPLSPERLDAEDRLFAHLSLMITDNDFQNTDLLNTLRASLRQKAHELPTIDGLRHSLLRLIAIPTEHPNATQINKSVVLAYKMLFEQGTWDLRHSYFDQNHGIFAQHSHALPWLDNRLFAQLGAAIALIGLITLIPTALLATHCFYLGFTSSASYSGLAHVMGLLYLGIAAVSAAISYGGYRLMNRNQVFEHKVAARLVARNAHSCRDSVFAVPDSDLDLKFAEDVDTDHRAGIPQAV